MTNEGNFLLPDCNDKLFIDLNQDYRHNAIVSTGMDKFFLFSESYKMAAETLFEQLDGSAHYANYLVYPLIFLNRQFLELRLKELIIGLNYIITGERKFPNGHDLKNLWNDFNTLVLRIGNENIPERKVLQNTESLILEFNSIDPQSFSFRYPVDKTNERNSSLKITTIDLLNFKGSMKKLYNFFDTQSDMIFHLIDLKEEFIDVIRSEYESEMRSYYENY